MSVEHLCNAIMLLEKGNFSKKHFGDFSKLKEFKEKYKSDLAEIYQNSYNFRSYGDYRKFPELGERFNRNELNNQIKIISPSIRKGLNIIGKKINIAEVYSRLDKVQEYKKLRKPKNLKKV